jgi:hypothetical protein
MLFFADSWIPATADVSCGQFHLNPLPSIEDIQNGTRRFGLAAGILKTSREATTG